MNWEELENILRSRQTESEDAVMKKLMEAIGHDLGRKAYQHTGEPRAVPYLRAFWHGYYATRGQE